MFRVFSYCFFVLFLTSCYSLEKTPLTKDHIYYLPPNYSKDKNWVALPWKKDVADKTPTTELINQQDKAEVDVFYVHPTTFKSNRKWNAKLNKKGISRFVEQAAVQHHGSVFNESCKVYSPMYREATLNAYFSESGKTEQAFSMAYWDVRAAFLYYKEHYNNGRPFILAAHSQGSSHLISLLMEFENSSFIKDKMVVAYLVGMPVYEHYFKSLKPCRTANETNCYCTWSTYAYNYNPTNFYSGAIVSNPINWTIDGTYASETENLGGVGFRFNRVIPNFTDARSKDGILWVRKPNYFLGKTVPLKNYHIADINLFWLNIRKNVADRVSSFQNQVN